MLYRLSADIAKRSWEALAFRSNPGLLLQQLPSQRIHFLQVFIPEVFLDLADSLIQMRCPARHIMAVCPEQMDPPFF